MDTTTQLGNSSGKTRPRAVLLHVPTGHMHEVWPRIAPMFLVFEERGPQRYSRSDLFWKLAVGQMQLHLVYDGARYNLALITEIIEYPQSKVCQIIYATGEDIVSVLPLIDELTEWARRLGANEMVIAGRPGWERHMKQFGFGNKTVALSRRIDPCQVQVDQASHDKQ